MQIKSAIFYKSAQDAKGYPQDALPHIAVAGRSNVGKSSLLNFLVQRKNLVKTSQMPGKTKLINFFLINDAFYLVDIPGFGYAKTGREIKREMEEAIEGYFKSCKSVVGLLYLVDIRMTNSPVDRDGIKWLSDFEIPILVLATKVDKFGKEKSRMEAKKIAAEYDLPEAPILTSADKKMGRDEVLEQMQILLDSAKPV